MVQRGAARACGIRAADRLILADRPCGSRNGGASGAQTPGRGELGDTQQKYPEEPSKGISALWCSPIATMWQSLKDVKVAFFEGSRNGGLPDLHGGDHRMPKAVLGPSDVAPGELYTALHGIKHNKFQEQRRNVKGDSERNHSLKTNVK
ncbi:unnamed protein product [Rangifer tarandus platyrhynchus]|uniref:Uncharacterized protein n=1 Tax=Rangifer tarandus platyrhynchus TaxID=3082113 RepID=A0AC59Z1M0_RANTA